MSERDQTNRRRCCVTGCNPVLIGEQASDAHKAKTGHRTAKWPIRSAAGKRKARERNKTGYYDQYNVGHKARTERFDADDQHDAYDDHPFSEEAVQG